MNLFCNKKKNFISNFLLFVFTWNFSAAVSARAPLEKSFWIFNRWTNIPAKMKALNKNNTQNAVEPENPAVPKSYCSAALRREQA